MPSVGLVVREQQAAHLGEFREIRPAPVDQHVQARIPLPLRQANFKGMVSDGPLELLGRLDVAVLSKPDRELGDRGGGEIDFSESHGTRNVTSCFALRKPPVRGVNLWVLARMDRQRSHGSATDPTRRVHRLCRRARYRCNDGRDDGQLTRRLGMSTEIAAEATTHSIDSGRREPALTFVERFAPAR